MIISVSVIILIDLYSHNKIEYIAKGLIMVFGMMIKPIVNSYSSVGTDRIKISLNIKIVSITFWWTRFECDACYYFRFGCRKWMEMMAVMVMVTECGDVVVVTVNCDNKFSSAEWFIALKYLLGEFDLWIDAWL